MTRKLIWRSGDSLPTFTNHLQGGTGTLTPSIVDDYIRLSYANPNPYLYVDMNSISDYVIQSGDYLEYDIYWETAGAILIAMDFTLSDGNEFRDSGAVDQNGLSPHPSADISARCSGVWYHRKIPFTTFTGGSSIGKTVTYFDIVCEMNSASTVVGRIRNMAITDGNGVNLLYTKTLTETVSFVDTLLRSLFLIEILTLTDTVSKTSSRIFTEIITFTDSVLKTTSKIFSEIITFTDSVVKTANRILIDTITLTDTLIKQSSRVLTETLNFLDILGDIVLNRISSGIKKTIISLFKGEFFGSSRQVEKPTGIIRSSEKPELV